MRIPAFAGMTKGENMKKAVRPELVEGQKVETHVVRASILRRAQDERSSARTITIALAILLVLGSFSALWLHLLTGGQFWEWLGDQLAQ